MVRLGKAAISSIKKTGRKNIAITWKKNEKASGYQLMYAANSAFTKNKKLLMISGKTTVKKTVTGLTKGKTYYVKVRAYKTVKGKKYYGPWSSVKSYKLK